MVLSLGALNIEGFFGTIHLFPLSWPQGTTKNGVIRRTGRSPQVEIPEKRAIASKIRSNDTISKKTV